MDTDQEILQDFKNVAGFLKNEALTQAEYEEHGKFGLSTVRYHFGTWNRAKTQAGLRLNGPETRGKVLEDEELLNEIVRLTKQLKKIPTESEMGAFGRYSPRPYKRWGGFAKAREVAYKILGRPDF